MGTDWTLLGSHTQIIHSSRDAPNGTIDYKSSSLDQDGGTPEIVSNAQSSENLDPFIVPESDLKPVIRLLKITKSGERIPVTFRYYSKTTALRVGFPVPLNYSTTVLYGIEYDDPKRGKHEGVYEGRQLFECRQKGVGAGAFLLSPKDLRRGYTFAEALAERYDVDITGVKRIARLEEGEEVNLEKGLKLGSSGIVVEAPGIEEVQKRLKHLGRLQSIGLEGYHVSRLGGDEDTEIFLRDNLTSLMTLDLSDNLLTFWSDVADIVACIPSLRKLILNRSRIEQIARNKFDPQKQAFIRETMINIREIELCDSCVSWEDVMIIALFLPHLERLDLVDNKPLVSLEPMRTLNGVPVLLELRYLNLSGCGISDWETLMVGIRSLIKLETLDISNTPLTYILAPPPSTQPIHLPNLILLSTKIASWQSIDALQLWTSSSLLSLKFSLFPSSSDSTNSDPNQRILGDQSTERFIIISKLPGLTMLNSSPISAPERRDAEIRYIRMVDRLVDGGKGKKEDWGRYDELKKIHGTEETKDQTVNLRLGHLRSRLYNLTIFTQDDKGVYKQSAELAILPSAPIALLRKKMHKALGKTPGQEVSIWTVSERFVEGERGKANEVPDGEVVEWWFADGDEIIAES